MMNILRRKAVIIPFVVFWVLLLVMARHLTLTGNNITPIPVASGKRAFIAGAHK